MRVPFGHHVAFPGRSFRGVPHHVAYVRPARLPGRRGVVARPVQIARGRAWHVARGAWPRDASPRQASRSHLYRRELHLAHHELRQAHDAFHVARRELRLARHEFRLARRERPAFAPTRIALRRHAERVAFQRRPFRVRLAHTEPARPARRWPFARLERHAPGTGGVQIGRASYYSGSHTTASGGHVGAATCASRTLPFGTKVLVTNLANAHRMVLTVNDRGPYVGGRIVDVSRGAAGQLGMVGAGVAPVRVEVIARR